MPTEPSPPRPLDGVSVLELGQLMAGPFAGTILGYYGAEVIKVEYDRCGEIREPSGSTITGVVPTNTYLCRDGKHVIIGGNGDSIFRRLMTAAGRPEMGSDPRLATNVGRVKHQEEVDGALAAWTATLTMDQVLGVLEEARVPAGPINSVVEMVSDPPLPGPRPVRGGRGRRPAPQAAGDRPQAVADPGPHRLGRTRARRPQPGDLRRLPGADGPGDRGPAPRRCHLKRPVTASGPLSPAPRSRSRARRARARHRPGGRRRRARRRPSRASPRSSPGG